jgi:hypothetical protein
MVSGRLIKRTSGSTGDDRPYPDVGLRGQVHFRRPTRMRERSSHDNKPSAPRFLGEPGCAARCTVVLSASLAFGVLELAQGLKTMRDCNKSSALTIVRVRTLPVSSITN